MSRIEKFFKYIKSFSFTAFLSGLCTPVLAALPKLEAPSRGEGQGILATSKNYSYDAVEMVSLVIAAAVVLGVAYVIGATFIDVRNGKKTFGDLILYAVIGFIVIVLDIYLVNKAVDIF